MSPDTRAHNCRYANEASTIELETKMGSCDASSILREHAAEHCTSFCLQMSSLHFNFSHAGNETPEQTGLDQRTNLQIFHYCVHPSVELIFLVTCHLLSHHLPEANLASIRLKDTHCASCKTRPEGGNL